MNKIVLTPRRMDSQRNSGMLAAHICSGISPVNSLSAMSNSGKYGLTLRTFAATQKQQLVTELKMRYSAPNCEGCYHLVCKESHVFEGLGDTASDSVVLDHKNNTLGKHVRLDVQTA